MKIKELILTNFRCFKNASFQFNPDYNLHELIAPNMKRKTAVMEALRIVVGPLLKRVFNGELEEGCWRCLKERDNGRQI